MALKDLNVKFTANTKDLDKGFQSASKGIKNLNSQASSLSGAGTSGFLGLTGAAGGLTAALGPVGIAIGVVMGGVSVLSNVLGSATNIMGNIISQIISFSAGCIQLGSSLIEIQNVVDVTFGALSSKVDAFASTAFKKFGESEAAVKKFAGTSGAMLKSMGLPTKAALDMSLGLTGLAGSFASFFDTTPDIAFEKIRSGMAGEIEPLRQWGIEMSVANLEAYALSQGIKVSYERMSQANQAVLRYNYLMSVSTDAQGDFIRTSGSWANQVRTLTLQWDMFRTSIGQGLILAFTPAIQAINVFMGWLVSLGSLFQKVMGMLFSTTSAIDSAAKSTSGMAKSGDKAANSTGKLAKGLSAAGSAAKRMLAPFDQINVLMSGSGGGGAAPEIDIPIIDNKSTDDLKETLDTFMGQFDFTNLIKAWDNLKAALKPIGDEVWNGLKWAYDNILVPLGKWVIAEALPASIDVFSAALKVVSSTIDALKPLGKWLWDNFLRPLGEFSGKAFIGFLNILVDLFNKFSDWVNNNQTVVQNLAIAIGAVAAALAAVVAAPILSFLTILGQLFTVVAIPIGGMIVVLFGFITTLRNITDRSGEMKIALINAWESVKTAWGKAGTWFADIWSSIKLAFASVGTFFGDLWETIKTKFTTIGSSIASAVSNAFKTTVNSVFSMLESKINSFIDSINSVINLINLIPGVRLSSIGHISIPRLEKGGVVNTPTVAMVGEAGREAVMPLENNTGWITELAQKIVSVQGRQLAMAGGDITIPIYLDGGLLDQVIVRAQDRKNIRSNGR